MLPYLYEARTLTWAGQRQIGFQTGFNDALFGRPNDNPYDISVVGGSHAAYEEGYEQGLISDVPPRGPKGDTGDTGSAGGTGSSGSNGTDGDDGNQHFVGNGAPSNGLGNDGDVYTDADNGDIYLKITGSWSLQGSPGSVTLTTRTDTVDPDVVPTVTYRGDALPGTATSGSTWRIQRMTQQSDRDIEILFEDGDDNFDNIWDNRLSGSYS